MNILTHHIPDEVGILGGEEVICGYVIEGCRFVSIVLMGQPKVGEPNQKLEMKYIKEVLGEPEVITLSGFADLEIVEENINSNKAKFAKLLLEENEANKEVKIEAVIFLKGENKFLYCTNLEEFKAYKQNDKRNCLEPYTTPVSLDSFEEDQENMMKYGNFSAMDY